MSTWGALRPSETVPLAFFAPPHASSGLRCRVQRCGPRNPSLGFGEGCATRTSMGPPPQAGRLGLELDTWQDSPLRRNKALPSMIPHRSTKQGTLAQRRGIGGGMVEQTHTHTHTRTAPAARLRAKAHSVQHPANLMMVASSCRCMPARHLGRHDTTKTLPTCANSSESWPSCRTSAQLRSL